MRWLDLKVGDVVDLGYATPNDASLRLVTKSRRSPLGGEVQEIDLVNLSTGSLSEHTRRADDAVTAWYTVLRGDRTVQEGS